ncbi:uncharacterized protein (DUF4415 family) [Sinorhizobium fredii]|uniref:Uncharacterized protein n=1 Tax=Sinorhizobium fredii (strain USDA 257) TaxID=1185652 RepID=I3WZK6_SINF2|nr:BrnA antitoxin family protein [Sinorhizobium fredii]AFL49062.1 hypothetical protein USDA257_c04650 [Sinorhizobium fredii USDA 257]
MTKLPRHMRHISDEEEAEIQRKIASDPEAPEATDEELAQARPFAEVFPDLAESIKRARGRPAVENPRKQISLRLDPDIIEHYKRKCGKGWQNRMNDDLRKAAGLKKAG